MFKEDWFFSCSFGEQKTSINAWIIVHCFGTDWCMFNGIANKLLVWGLARGPCWEQQLDKVLAVTLLNHRLFWLFVSFTPLIPNYSRYSLVKVDNVILTHVNYTKYNFTHLQVNRFWTQLLFPSSMFLECLFYFFSLKLVER